MPGEPPQAAMPAPESARPDTPAAVGSAAAAAKAPGGSTAGEQAAAPKVAAPSGSTEESAPAPVPAAGGKPVRDVPNLRVLAPALVKPVPAEGAPSSATSAASPETGGVPPAMAPKVDQTAALPKAAPSKAARAAAGGQFLVQLASVNSEKQAEREWSRLQKAFPNVFGERALVVEKKEIAGRGTFYRVQSGGLKSLDEARSLCAALKDKKQACLPVKR
jgi:hypothetical protein